MDLLRDLLRDLAHSLTPTQPDMGEPAICVADKFGRERVRTVAGHCGVAELAISRGDFNGAESEIRAAIAEWENRQLL